MCQLLIIFVSNTVQSLHQVVVSERRSNAAAQAMQYKSARCCTCSDGRQLGQLYVKDSMLVHSGVWFSACLFVQPWMASYQSFSLAMIVIVVKRKF